MSLFSPLDFSEESIPQEPVDPGDKIPKELNIFYRQESAFLPEGKSIKDLTPEQLAKLKVQYRFDIFKPGIGQTISGFGHML